MSIYITPNCKPHRLQTCTRRHIQNQSHRNLYGDFKSELQIKWNTRERVNRQQSQSIEYHTNRGWTAKYEGTEQMKNVKLCPQRLWQLMNTINMMYSNLFHQELTEKRKIDDDVRGNEHTMGMCIKYSNCFIRIRLRLMPMVCFDILSSLWVPGETNWNTSCLQYSSMVNVVVDLT